jgi:hypothetical protein
MSWAHVEPPALELFVKARHEDDLFCGGAFDWYLET